jgi:hypothetical protein
MFKLQVIYKKIILNMILEQIKEVLLKIFQKTKTKNQLSLLMEITMVKVNNLKELFLHQILIGPMIILIIDIFQPIFQLIIVML